MNTLYLPEKYLKFHLQYSKTLGFLFLMIISSLRDLYNVEGQISQPVAYFNGPNLPDQSQHPPYIPPCTIPLILFKLITRYLLCEFDLIRNFFVNTLGVSSSGWISSWYCGGKWAGFAVELWVGAEEEEAKGARFSGE